MAPRRLCKNEIILRYGLFRKFTIYDECNWEVGWFYISLSGGGCCGG